MLRRLVTISAVTMLVTCLSSVTQAGDWSEWRPFGTTGISIRFAQVNRTTCTWAFRNDSSRVLKSMSFRIDDINAESGRPEQSSDQIPWSLRPGQSIGGWTAFTAEADCSTVRITSTSIEWQ